MSESNSMESRIYELKGPRDLFVRIESLDLAGIGSKQVAARTLFSAVSPGTEIAAFAGDPPLRPGKAYPRVVGYCNVAEVIAVGSEVRAVLPGDRILTAQSHRSSFVISEDRILARVPTEADPVEASTTYLFHLGYNALLRGEFVPGTSVAVVGLGTLGLCTVALASSFGGDVYAYSDQTASRDLAVKFGAECALAKGLVEGKPPVEGGVDLVISTAGSWEDWKLAIRLARKGGTVCVLGFPGRTNPIPDFNPIDSQYFYDSQLKLVACGYTTNLDVPRHDVRFTLQRNCEFLLKRIQQRKLPARTLISSVVPWTELGQVYERLSERKSHHLTSVLQWN